MFGLKLGPAGLVVQVFQVRSGRVVERIELGTETPPPPLPPPAPPPPPAGDCRRDEGEVLEAAIQQFYELRVAPPEVHVPAEPTTGTRSKRGSVPTPGGASGCSCRSEARSAG